jgi:hypothetical protein
MFASASFLYEVEKEKAAPVARTPTCWQRTLLWVFRIT